jgi:hypothetical protein
VKNKELAKLLWLRNFNVTMLADQIFSARTHLVRVLLGQRCGTNTWPKLKRVLTEKEYATAKAYAEQILRKRQSAGEPTGAFKKVSLDVGVDTQQGRDEQAR